MNEINQVLQFAKHLQSSGKTPTTALLKAKLGKTIPMPTILRGLQQFKSLSEKEISELVVENKASEQVSTKANISLEEQVKQLQNQVTQLQSEQTALLKRIEQIEKQQ
ncbi:hypothetical protein D5018_20260 [Parashewanella curva]|uniref:KfrA N-terminal DNA-binding domain-containing protein n=1 Tax=Parashewanella curva TaxID=2338552 RepID=A0A3L8PV08_9GAMM|nr:DNA-binding protein [Parashewanella curva]RLV57872.1 hypothetical protein D5018_20260 [Parashewanella curva]